ncbi:sugar transferase [Thalassobacillus hwangdonensis]|uniref:Sugar transferase n=1 Tax=Thalassobacillus hwangdonensis TaxID=546108 RepID=A0ABW3L4M8_9BACI
MFVWKRVFDLLAAIVLLLLLLVPIVLTACLVRMKLGSPILFTQTRIGYKEQPFKIYKFRTMTDKRDEQGNLLPDEMRITKTGMWIRKLSLDEFPQLLNIFKGDMSLVGPRPLLTRYLPFYTEEESKRHLVRPGITGLAQIKGRNFVDWQSRFELDVEYVNNQSLWLDLKILLITLIKVLRKDGVEDVPCKTMLDFDVERKLKGGYIPRKEATK